MTVGDMVHATLEKHPNADYILLSSKKLFEYKRELLPASLPDPALHVVAAVHAKTRDGRKVPVIFAALTKDGRQFVNLGDGYVAMISSPENPITAYRS